MNPIDPEIGDAHILKSFILYRAVQDPEIFDQTSDVFSVLGKRTVKVLFSKAKPLKLKDEKVEKDAPVSILVVPCFVDSQTITLSLRAMPTARRTSVSRRKQSTWNTLKN